MRKLMILVIFTTISGCCSVPVPLKHPDLTFPSVPALPKFTREMLNCGKDHPETTPLCRKIKEREAVLRDHIDTQIEILDTHNEELK